LSLCDVTSIVQNKIWLDADLNNGVGRNTAGITGLQIGPDKRIYSGLYDPDSFYRDSDVDTDVFASFPNPNKADFDSVYFDRTVVLPIYFEPGSNRYGVPN